jgi:hypothetical protein
MAVAFHFHHTDRVALRRLYTRVTKDKKQRYTAIGWWCPTCGENYDGKLKLKISGALSEYTL